MELRFYALIPLCITLLAGCGRGDSGSGYLAGDRPPDRPRADPGKIVDAVPRVEKLCGGCNNRYRVLGQSYQPLSSGQGYVERGIASWYGQKFHGRATATGETYDMYAASAAHRTLPLPSYARVTNLKNGQSIVVKVNDRGPFVDNRLIDLSYAAASRLGIIEAGTGLVEVRAVSPGEPLTPLTTTSAWTAHPPQLHLQVGAFVDQNNAQRLQQRLRQSGFTSVLIQQTVRWGQPLYRVQIGPITQVMESDRISARLTSQGYDTVRVIVE